MVTPEYVDRWNADDAEFTALLARVEQQPACEEDTVERVARATCSSDAEVHGTYEWDQCSEELREDHRRVARAAIDALKPAPGTDNELTRMTNERDLYRNAARQFEQALSMHRGQAADSGGQALQRDSRPQYLTGLPGASREVGP